MRISWAVLLWNVLPSQGSNNGGSGLGLRINLGFVAL